MAYSSCGTSVVYKKTKGYVSYKRYMPNGSLNFNNRINLLFSLSLKYWTFPALYQCFPIYFCKVILLFMLNHPKKDIFKQTLSAHSHYELIPIGTIIC